MTPEAVCSTWHHLTMEDKSKWVSLHQQGISFSSITDESGHGPHISQHSVSTTEGEAPCFGWRTILVIISQRGKTHNLSSWQCTSWEDPLLTTVNLKDWFFEARPRKYIHGYFQGEPINPKSQIQFLGSVFWVHIIRGKGLSRTDGIQAAPSVNYTHLCYHLMLQGEFSIQKSKKLRMASVNPSATKHHTTVPVTVQSELPGEEVAATGIRQGFESHHPWTPQGCPECNDWGLNYHLLRLG